jgi:hypothetical protein
MAEKKTPDEERDEVIERERERSGGTTATPDELASGAGTDSPTTTPNPGNSG